MELPNSESNRTLEDDQDAGKDMAVEAETSATGEECKEDDKFVALNEKSTTEYGTPSILASGMKKPQGLVAKTKIVKKVKKLVRRKGTDVPVSCAPVEQGIKEDSPDESQKRIKAVADSPPCSSGKDKHSVTSPDGHDMEFAEIPQPADDNEIVTRAEPSGKEILEEVNVNSSILKTVGIRLHNGGKVKGALSQEMGKGNAPILQGHKEVVKMDSVAPGGNLIEATEGAIESPENDMPVKKKPPPRKLRPKAKLGKAPPSLLARTEADKRTPELEQNDNSLNVNEQQRETETLNLLEVNACEGGQQKIFDDKIKQNQLSEDKTGWTENKRRRKKRQRNQVLSSNKKQRKEVVAAADATQQRMQDGKDKLAGPEKQQMDRHGNAKIGGLIFMCNAKTRPDCFRFSIMGVQEKRKDYVRDIKPGLKLFLYDYDLKLLYGIFQASSAGGMKLERNAFGGSFPAQVRFKVVKDCIPLPESQFKKAIKENYNNRNKFKTELTPKQVVKLKKLFRPAALPAQLTYTLPVSAPRDADRNRSNKDRYAPSSSRTNPTRGRERSRNATHTSPPPRREEPPHDLYLSEREYRTYGLRRAETCQHHPIPPPESFYRDRVPLDSYHPSVYHDWLLIHPEVERRDRREVRSLHLPERDYHMYDHLSSRRDILARNSLDSPTSGVALDSYRRDPYYIYEYRASERPPRTYLASPGREDGDLYSRYVTADSLADYYRSPRRYPSMAESELLPSAVTSRYAYSGSLPYSHR